MTLDQTLQLALQRHQAGRMAEAETLYKQILEQQPGSHVVLHLLGVVAAQDHRYQTAIEFIRRAIAIQPSIPDYHTNLGNAQHALGRFDEAIASQHRALALRPDFAEAFSNLGIALLDMGRCDESVASYQRAIALKPGYAIGHSNLGNALLAMGRLDDAIGSYRQALSLNPNYAQGHMNLAIALLVGGNLAEGWREYEWRWKCASFPSPRRDFPQPQWGGEPLAGRTLLIHSEQGLGDTIHVSRYLPLLDRTAGTIVVECQASLKKLLQRTIEAPVWVTKEERLPAFDVHCPLLSLPLLFATTLDTIPRRVPYLQADPTSKWRGRLADVKALKVGIAWAGSATHAKDRLRSVALSSLAPLSQVEGVRFYSLQKGDAAIQASAPPAGLRLVDWTNELDDFDETASLIDSLDLVVSVDTAIVHLAGALGKPVWTMLPFAPDWRWLRGRADSPWYPTMRLFRQPKFGDWTSVVNDVVAALRAFRVAPQ